MDAGGSNVTPLGVSGYSPDWSADGTLVLFYQGFGAGNWDVTVMAAGGGPVTVLTEDPEFDGAPEWSPDGKQITFTSRRDDGDHEVYVMEADGSEETRLTDRVGGDEDPSWEPLPETWGDLNCDGLVNADDLMISLKHAARVPYELPEECGPLVG
jgi:Tol biopolymer transport system component